MAFFFIKPISRPWIKPMDEESSCFFPMSFWGWGWRGCQGEGLDVLEHAIIDAKMLDPVTETTMKTAICTGDSWCLQVFLTRFVGAFWIDFAVSHHYSTTSFSKVVDEGSLHVILYRRLIVPEGQKLTAHIQSHHKNKKRQTLNGIFMLGWMHSSSALAPCSRSNRYWGPASVQLRYWLL